MVCQCRHVLEQLHASYLRGGPGTPLMRDAIRLASQTHPWSAICHSSPSHRWQRTRRQDAGVEEAKAVKGVVVVVVAEDCWKVVEMVEAVSAMEAVG